MKTPSRDRQIVDAPNRAGMENCPVEPGDIPSAIREEPAICPHCGRKNHTRFSDTCWVCGAFIGRGRPRNETVERGE